MMAAEGKLEEDGSPAQITSSAWADYMTAVGSAAAVCGALFHRQRTGEGQKVNTSLLRSAIWGQSHQVNREPVTDSLFTDPMLEEMRAIRQRGGGYQELVAMRQGRRSLGTQFALYYSGYETRDGGIILGALSPANRAAFRQALDLEGEHSDDPDYDALDPENIRLGEQFKEEIRSKMRTKTVAEWLEIFDRAGAPAAPVNFPEELLDDPQARAEGIFVDLVHEVTGPTTVVGPLFEMSLTPTAVQSASPPLARDTRAVLEEAGWSSAEIEGLVASGIVQQA
jgi:crotonobetainyl-CoA:carnitine CoA-transferase CaiB-like acyl-CoA transferase